MDALLDAVDPDLELSRAHALPWLLEGALEAQDRNAHDLDLRPDQPALRAPLVGVALSVKRLHDLAQEVRLEPPRRLFDAFRLDSRLERLRLERGEALAEEELPARGPQERRWQVASVLHLVEPRRSVSRLAGMEGEEALALALPARGPRVALTGRTVGDPLFAGNPLLLGHL